MTTTDETTINVRGTTIVMNQASSYERYRIETYESKEPETLDWIDSHFGPGDVLYDVGANVGNYALYAALREPDGIVVAFEPSASNCAALLGNIRRNRLQNVLACCFALSSDRRFDHLYLAEVMAGASMHAFGERGFVQAFGEDVRGVQGTLSISLDQVVQERLPPPTLLKIDVDGTEAEILDGATETLRSQELRSVLLELNTTGELEDHDCLDRMREAGLVLDRTGPIWRRGEMAWQNHLFVREPSPTP